MRKSFAFIGKWIVWLAIPFFTTFPDPASVRDKPAPGLYAFAWMCGLTFFVMGICMAFAQNWDGLFWASLFYLGTGIVYRELGREIDVKIF